ncbi:hypothetical protein BDC45DRAFT_541508 [Circinella umbellata]|nr:hypothetical protein BDC45DRAFT_541508 [Circinella umbellata]
MLLVETKLDKFLNSEKAMVMKQDHTAYSARMTSAQKRFLEKLVTVHGKSRKSINIHQSAHVTGRDPMKDLSEEQRHEYLKKHRFGPFSLIEQIVNRNTPSVISTVLKVSDEHQWLKTVTKDLVWIATCLFCDDTFLAGHNTFHWCPVINTDIQSQRDGIIIKCIGIEASNAVTILKDFDIDRFEHLKIGSTQMWKLYDKAETMNTITKHLNDPVRRESPLVHITCGVVDEPLCNYNTLSHPSQTRDIKEGMPHIPFTTQHSHHLTDSTQDELEEIQKGSRQKQDLK